MPPLSATHGPVTAEEGVGPHDLPHASRNEPWPLRVTEEFHLITTDDGTPALQARARPGSFLPEVTISPLDRGDVRPLPRVFDGLSPRSRRMRFLAATP